MGSTHGIGIKRNDYRRANRKENKGHRWRGGGGNVGMRGVVLADSLTVAQVPRDRIEHRAVRDWQKFNKGHQYESEQLDAICLGYIRHKLTNYDRLATALYGEALVQLKKTLFEKIALSYPWLAEKCQSTLENHLLRPHVRVVKRQTLTGLLLAEHNDRENAAFHGHVDTPHFEDDSDGVVGGSQASSLKLSRLLYLPPFLKPDEIRLRRFGGQPNMNDRWWEWEEEKGIRTRDAQDRFRWAS